MKKTGLAGGGLNVRALASLSMICAAVWLPPSGIALHFAAQGSSALAQHVLMSLHNTAAALFASAAILHVWLNRKALVQHFRTGVSGTLRLRRELTLAVLGVSGLIALIESHALHVK